MKNIFNLKNLKLGMLIAVEVLKRKKWKLLIGLLSLILIFYVQAKFKLFYQPNSLSLGLVGTYQEHDLPLEVTRLLSEGLVEADGSGHVRPKLVSGWDTNHDATVFKFKLKEGLRWIDNTPIKSSDLGFAIPNVETGYPDDQTIQFSLKQSFSPLPSLLTKPVMKKGTLLGKGSYKITKIRKSRIFITKIELESDDPQLPKISVRFYPNESAAVTGFNLGEVQALLGLSNIKTFLSNPKVSLKQKTEYTKIVSILFNTKDNLLSSRSLRQALSYASPKIDFEEIANNPYPPKLWAFDPDAKKYLANLDEAKSALERAQSSLPEEKLATELILTTTPNLEEVGKTVVNAWRQLGLAVKLRIESGIAQNFQSLLITQSIPEDPDQYALWHATQTKTNLTKYDSKRVDKDLEDGRRLITEEDRKEKYFDFQKTLLEDTPAIFLYFPKYNIVYLKKKEKLLDKILLSIWRYGDGTRGDIPIR